MSTRGIILLLSVTFALLTAQPVPALSPEGIVYESEAIAQPDSAWLRNKRTGDHWTLWMAEEDIEKKRSGKAVLASPASDTDHATPEEGAPPLHCVVDDLEPGVYRIYLSNPGARPLAYSLDGQTWFKHQRTELALGTRHLPEGRFEVWVDDRYAYPFGQPGAGYFDYVRFVPVPDAAQFVKRYVPWPAMESPNMGLESAFDIPLTDSCELKGFEVDGTLLKGGAHAGDSFSWVSDRDGAYYPAVVMVDDEDGIEQLTIRHNDEVLACAVGDKSAARALFSLTRPLTLAKGDRLSFTADTPVGFYRVLRVLFAKDPIVPPPPSFDYVEPWSPEPGAVDVCWTTSVVVETGAVEYETGGVSLRTEHDPYRGRNHRVKLRGLTPSAAYTARILTTHDQESMASQVIQFTAAPPEAGPTKAFRVPITVPEPTDTARTSWPATVGMPFAKGALARLADLRLLGADGSPIPLQADLFSRWPDGSVKWATLSFLADTA
ncbi:MAG: hypothetical protein GY851_05005, partial [bacterium]|nr:hypothetical protein [bacterium]